MKEKKKKEKQKGKVKKNSKRLKQIILSVSGLDISLKRQRLSDWIKKLGSIMQSKRDEDRLKIK